MEKRLLNLARYSLVLTVTLGFFLAGCQKIHRKNLEKPAFQGTEKIAIVGFRAALDEDDSPHTVRDPLSGTVFMAEPVLSSVAREMTGELFARLKERSDRVVLPPGQALGAYSNLASRDINLSLLPNRMLQEIGKSLGAEYVLSGYIYRWTERQGTGYAVNRAASVAFSLHLLRVADARIVWNGNFDKTQRSLSENLLDLKTFLGGGGRWMSARELGFLGLKQLLVKMP
jgi:hypothetical protein